MIVETLAVRAGGWLAKIGVKFAIAGLVLLAIAFCAWRAIATFEAMIDAADARGAERERLKWEAQIAESNRALLASHLAAERAARVASDEAAGELATLRKTLEDLEKANAANPSADSCGLSRPRSGLLPAPARRAGDP